MNLLVEPAIAGFPVAWYAPTYKTMVEVYREVKVLLKPLISRANASEFRIELKTGGVIEFWSISNPDVSRGRKYARVVIDEAAIIPILEEAWNKAIRATLTDYKGDAWFLSTPKGRNFFHVLWQRGQDPLRKTWASWHMPTVSNPFIDPEEVEDARTDIPERAFNQEYLAEFLEFEGAVFRRIQEAAVAELRDEPALLYDADGRERGRHQYAFGVDWGKVDDFTVITVVDLNTRACVYMDRFQQLDWHVQRGRLAALYERFLPDVVIAEANSIGGPNVEELWRQGIPVQAFTTTHLSKNEIIESLALDFEKGAFTIIPDAVLMAELAAFEATRLPSGLIRYAAPNGVHDDCVMSLALAHHALDNAGPYSHPDWANEYLDEDF